MPRFVSSLVALVVLGLAGCSSSREPVATTGAREAGPSVPPDAFSVTVDRVVDGDTFIARRSGRLLRVRLIGIDAPESVRPDAPVDCFGPESSRALKALLAPGTTVRAAYQGTPQQDRFGRELWDVWLQGRFLQGRLVSSGYARARAYEPQTRYADLLAQLGAEADRAGTGLFGACPHRS